jgi:very-short-patch-repair endonuclease
MREGQNSSIARRLRRSANFPERKAWDALRRLRKHGVVVRRQHPIGSYVVDFAIAKTRLVIEIDGGVHTLSHVAERDLARQNEIESLGWRVIRIPSEIALSADHLLERIQRELGL